MRAPARTSHTDGALTRHQSRSPAVCARDTFSAVSSKAARRPILCGEEVPAGGHICAFFSSRAEKYDTLVPYFKSAIEAGERVINVVDASLKSAHERQLESMGVPVQQAVRQSRFQLHSAEDVYMRDGELALDAVLDMLRESLVKAKTDGNHVRTCGEMNWIARNPGVTRKALEYEVRVNELLPGHDCTMLCVYDLAYTPSSLVADILATHPYAVINGRLRANPYAVEPAAYSAMLQSRS